MPKHQTNFDRLHDLYNLIINNHTDYQSTYQRYLDVGLKTFDLEFGIISRIENSQYHVLAISSEQPVVKVGDILDLATTFSSEVVKQKRAIGIDAIGQHQDLSQTTLYQQMKLETFLSAPIWVNNQIYGTLNFISINPKNHSFHHSDLEFITLMAKGIGSLLERDLLEQEKNAALLIMRENITLFTSAFECAPIGMALVSPQGKWLKVNQSLQQILGYDQEHLLQIDFQSVTHPDDLNNDLILVNKLLEDRISNYQMEKRYINSSGKTIWVNISVSLIHFDDGTPRYFIAQIENITHRKHIEQLLEKKQRHLARANLKLASQATHDVLTGLPNRRLLKEKFTDELIRASRNQQPLSIAILDIDYFKNYNDQFGHIEGDNALKIIASSITKNKRQVDTVARFGGEEFVILFPITDKSGCLLVCERIRQVIEKIDLLKQTITVSIGYTTYRPSHNDSNNERLLENLVAIADQALYLAKTNGRNQVAFLEMTNS